jgi:PAP2 superfamily protein
VTSMRAQVGRLVRPHHGAVEAAALVGMYGLYELCRGFADGSWVLAQRNAEEIVRFERDLGMFWEWDVQQWASQLPLLPVLLGLAYVGLHVGGTILALVWVHRHHREHFALLRTVIVAASAFALVVYVVFPTAPPRLAAGLGFADTVTDHAGINLNSTLLGELYNPIAAVPSLHFGYALVVGFAVAALARRRAVRALGAAYPIAMLFVIVATGNHFWLDAVAGGAVVLVAWLLARVLIEPAPAEHPAYAAAAST